jgi:hypothetical protein
VQEPQLKDWHTVVNDCHDLYRLLCKIERVVGRTLDVFEKHHGIKSKRRKHEFQSIKNR